MALNVPLTDWLTNVAFLEEELGISLHPPPSPIKKVIKRRRSRIFRDYKTSSWYELLRDKKEELLDETTAAAKTFRRRNRVPYVVFERLLVMAVECGFQLQPTDCAGRPGVPLSLHLMGVLRFLGRATLFDDIAEQTKADEETHRSFFGEFIKAMVKQHFNKFVYSPTGEELATTMRLYARHGFPGAVGSTDCTR